MKMAKTGWRGRINEIVFERARHIHVNAAQRIHYAAEAVKLNHRCVINTDTEVVLYRIPQQTGAASIISIYFTALIGGVDALHTDAWNINPQVAWNRNH